MARTMISLLMVGVLVIGLAIPVCASDPVFDSGVSTFSVARSSEVAALAATASASGSLGYHVDTVNWSYSAVNPSSSSYSILAFRSSQALEPGIYVFDLEISSPEFVSNLSFSGFPSTPTYILNGNHAIVTADLSEGGLEFDSDGFYQIAFRGPNTTAVSSMSVSSVSVTRYTLASGVSSGYTYNSGILMADNQSVYETISLSFGQQPAGDYILSIYHWGSDYTVDFMLKYGNRYLSSYTAGGVTSVYVSHAGGELALTGSFNLTHDVSFEITGGEVSGGGGFFNQGTGTAGAISGELDVSWPNSWTFNIVDVVAVPASSITSEQFGVFAPLVVFLRDSFSSIVSNTSLRFSELQNYLLTRFSSLHSHITNRLNDLKTHITTEITGFESLVITEFESLKTYFSDLFSADEDGAFEEGTTEAADQLTQVTEIEDQIFSDFENAAAAVDPSSVTISNDVLSGFAFLNDISVMVFNGLGSYQVLVIIPLMIGIASIVSGRGFTSAMARHSRTKKGGS